MTELLTRPETVTVADSETEPLWFYRYNPFARRRLAQPELREALAQIVDLDQAIEQATETALAELHELIGSSSDDERKGSLALSRALRRGKKLPDGSRPATVQHWEHLVRDREQRVTELSEQHPSAARAERRLLAELLGDRSLTESLALVSPEVGRQAERYTENVGPSGEGNARLLKSERGLLQYVLRAAMRTSPLAQLTAVGLAAPARGGSHPDRPLIGREVSFFSLDRVMLDYVVGGGLAAAADPVVALPPTSAVADGKLLYLAPQPDGGYRRVGVPLRPPLAQIVGLLALGPVRQSRLAETVAAGGAASDAGAVARFLVQAVAGGALCTVSPTTDEDLVDLSPRGVAVVDDTMRTLRGGMSQLTETSGADRVAVLSDMESALGELSRAVGRPARIGVTEDRVASLAPIDPQDWQPALADLGPAVELLHTFDWLADVALALRDAFVRHHGAGAQVNLVEVAPELVAQVTASAVRLTGAYTDSDPAIWDEFGGAESTLARLYAVRRHVEDAVRTHFDAAVAAGAEEVVLGHDDVYTMLADLPTELRRRPLGYGVLVQSTGDGLVINDGLPGHGMLYSRFLGMDRALGGRALARLSAGLQDRYGEAGMRLVEDRSLHNLSVNVHPQVLPDVLQPQDWPRLTLAHDPQQGELQVLDGAEPIKVLPLGGGHPGLYPPPLSVASGLVIAGRLYNGLPDSYAAAHPDPDEQTRRVPRMRVGNVVLSRARWFPGEDLHEVLAISDERERLLAVARWRAKHGVPEEVMVKSVPADSGPASVGSPDAQEVRFKSKPQYIDLSSALCVRVLPRMLERRGGPDAPAIYLEEATPGITEGPHATEWVVQVDRRSGGHFSYGGAR